MRNWSGYLTWDPKKIFYPESEVKIQKIIKKAISFEQKIRVIGSGHSFSPVCATNDILVSLDKYQGIISVDKEKLTATVKGGTKLFLLNQLLHKEGMAMENLGDIDQQSIAGAISTGTHGTGITFGSLSTQILSISFINGLGEKVTCSKEQNHELFKAAQVSLGTLGIITELTIQCVPSYKLELIIDKTTLEDVLSTYKEINNKNRNFEFYWFPNTEYVMTKICNITDDPVDKNGLKNYFQDYVLENYAFKLICEFARRFPSKSIWTSKFSAKTISHHRKVNYSHKVLIAPRLVKFNEMEYNVPIEAYDDALKDIVKWINKNNSTVHFPIENRFVKGDDIYLSPAYNRDSAYIACHVYNKKEFTSFFTALEEIFLSYEGRPHFGKINQFNKELMIERYPMFDAFCKLRETHDPSNIFISEYMHTLFIN